MADASSFFDNVPSSAVSSQFEEVDIPGEDNLEVVGNNCVLPQTQIGQSNGEAEVPVELTTEIPTEVEYEVQPFDNSASDTDDGTEESSEVVFDGRKAAIENSKSEAEIAKVKKEAQMQVNNMTNMICNSNGNNEKSEMVQETMGKADKTLENALAAAKEFEMFVNRDATTQQISSEESTEMKEPIIETQPSELERVITSTEIYNQEKQVGEFPSGDAEPSPNEHGGDGENDDDDVNQNVSDNGTLQEMDKMHIPMEEDTTPSQEFEEIGDKNEILDPAVENVVSTVSTNDASSLFGGPSETADINAFVPASSDQEVKAIDNLTMRSSTSIENLSISSSSPLPVVKDASSLFASADSLFGAPPKDSEGFDAVPGTMPSSSSAFNTVPVSNFDPFASPPPDNASLFNAPPPGALPASTLPPKNVAPADLFNFAAPVHVPAPTNPMAPPSAPGVRVPVVSPTPARSSTPPAPSNVNSKHNSPARPSKPVMQAPPGAIPTPHGFVVQNTPKQSQFQQPEVKIPQAPLSGTAPLEVKLMSNPAPAPISTQSSANLYTNNSPQLQQQEQDNTRNSSAQIQVPNPTIPTPYGMAPSQAVPTPYGFSAPPTGNTGNIPVPLPRNDGNVGFAGTVPSSSSTVGNRTNTRYSRPTTSFATFGFGGKLVLYNAGNGLMKGTTLKVHKTLQTIINSNNDSNACYKFGNEHVIRLRSFCSLLNNFPKPSSTNLKEECSKFVDERMMHPSSPNVSSEKMLLLMLKLLVSTNGSVNSELGCEDPSSPEARIIQMLLGQAANTPLTPGALRSPILQEAYGNHIEAMRETDDTKKAEVFSDIDAMLLCGSREEAASLAADRGEWGLALLIGSLCSPEIYKEIAVRYSNKTFPLNSSLNVITKLFSNQTDSMALSGSNTGNVDGLSFESTWKRNAASVVANKSTEWSSHLVSIGDRLKDPNQLNDVMAAHFTYLAGGLLPTAPGRHTKFSLIGHNYASSKVNTLVNEQVLLAFRLTELVELAMINHIDKSENKESDSGSTFSKSITGMFGLVGSSSTSTSQTEIPSEDTNSIKSNKVVPLNDKQVQEFRVAFAPMKLRFAMLLADFGNNVESYEYAMTIKDYIASVEEAHSAMQRAQLQKDRRGAGKLEEKKINKIFSTKFVRAVDEFYDRIGKTLSDDSKKNIKSSTGTVTRSSSGSSIWEFTGSVLSAAVGGANLKDFVDGPQNSENSSKPPLVPTPKVQSPVPIPPPTTQYDSSFQQPSQQTLGQEGGYSNGIQPTSTSGTDINLHAAPFQDNSGIKNREDNVNAVTGDRNFNFSRDTGEGNGRASSNVTSTQAPTSSKSAPGVISNVRKSLLGWMYPDAKDANDNLGTANEAYFDKATQKWVFPGEDPVEDVAVGPPPTSFAGPGIGSSSAVNKNADSGQYDPLAAMMAPPSRGPSYSSSGAYDPLAAMMAPPSRPMATGSAPPHVGNPAAVAAAPPQMWMPSPQPAEQPTVFGQEANVNGDQKNGVFPRGNVGGSGQ